MNRYFTISLLLFSFVFSACCNKSKCVNINPMEMDGLNPTATVQIKYKDAQGLTKSIIKKFAGSSNSMNYNIELPPQTNWSAYFQAKDASLKKFQTRWEMEVNGRTVSQEPWQIKEFLDCPRECWDRKVTFGESRHGHVYKLHLYAEDWGNRNTGWGNVYVRFSATETDDPEPDPDPVPDCEITGEIKLLLSLDDDALTKPTWKRKIPQTTLNKYCEGRIITQVKIPHRVNCSLVTTVCVTKWKLTVNDQTHENISCDEHTNECLLVFPEPVPLNDSCEFAITPPSFLFCEDNHQPCDDSTWNESVQIELTVQ